MILVAYGTRPEIIKLFPVINELRARQISFKTLFTGQQTDLFEDVKELVPQPDFSFAESFYGSGKHNTLGTSFIKICAASEQLFADRSFDMVAVQGDTTTAWALAQTAFYNEIRIAHVEAGLRTFDLANPYPEELNRTLIDQVAYLNFAPTRTAKKNLDKMGARNIHLVGNTIVDAVNYFKDRLGLKVISSKKVLITLHRRENHAIMDKLFDELQSIAICNPDLEFILPIHPNPNVTRHRSRLKAKNIRVVPPLGYHEMLKLMSQAIFMISDSGGIQEEATCFNKKVIIVRKVTERPEVVDMGLGVLAGQEIGKYIEWAKVPSDSFKKSPYGKGDAAKKIVQIIARSIEPAQDLGG
jgi:UDP-N-acetylglucosamine 2-epimerase (non-hydrolysing)